MTMRLSHAIRSTLLAAFIPSATVTALANVPAEYLTVPEGYTSVTVSSSDNFPSTVDSTDVAYVLTGDITSILNPLSSEKNYYITSQSPETPRTFKLSGGTYFISNSGSISNPYADPPDLNLVLTGLGDIEFSSFTGLNKEESFRINGYGAITYGWANAKVDLSYNSGNIAFTNNTVSSTEKSYLYSSVFTISGQYSSLKLNNNGGNVTFDGNKTLQNSGLSYSYSYAGAIYIGGLQTTASFDNNDGKVSFCNNQTLNTGHAASAGAINAVGTKNKISISGNSDGVLIQKNTATSTWTGNTSKYTQYTTSGGAIHAGGSGESTGSANMTLLSINNNKKGDTEAAVIIDANAAITEWHEAEGGAISTSHLDLLDNEGVILRNNYVSSSADDANKGDYYVMGGAICLHNAKFVSATDSSKNCGGLSISGNTKMGTDEASLAVSITGNYAISKANALVRGGAIASDRTHNQHVHILNNAGRVLISGNYVSTDKTDSAWGTVSATTAALGGAIYTGALSIEGNEGDVSFSGNYERSMDSTGTERYLLRSVVLDSGNYSGYLRLSAREGKQIIFYDSLYSGGNTSTVIINGATNINGTASSDGKDGLGKVVFTGETTERDLNVIKDGVDGTAEEIAASRTSHIGQAMEVHGGTLEVRNQAVLEGGDITLMDGSTLNLYNATIKQSGALTVQGGACLQAKGHLEGAGMTLRSGAVLKMTDATIKQSGTLTVEAGAKLTMCGHSVLEVGDLSNLSGVEITFDLSEAVESQAAAAAGMLRLAAATETETPPVLTLRIAEEALEDTNPLAGATIKVTGVTADTTYALLKLETYDSEGNITLPEDITWDDSITFITDEGSEVYMDENGVIHVAPTSIPEPTTATLSLLALTGLAARRRRR